MYYAQYQRDYWASKGIISPPPGHQGGAASHEHEEPIGANA
jgi:hypothetical protein